MFRNPPQRTIDPALLRESSASTAARPMAPKGRASNDDWALAITLLMFGAIGWVAGAFFTLHGWVVGLNVFFGWTSLPVSIPTPTGWWILACVPIGIIYSRVEMQIFRRRSGDWQATIRFVIGWLLIILTDIGTTYLGVRNPGSTLPILVWIASSAALSLAWAAVLTFASDWLIIGAWRLLRR